MSHVKANFDGDIRRFRLPAAPTFSDLLTQLSSLYSLSDFIIKYKDEEGDLVTLTSDAELAEAVAGATNGLLRLDVLRSPFAKPVAPVESAAADEPRAAPTEAPENTPERTPAQANVESGNDVDMDDNPEDIMEGLAGLFESLFLPMTAGLHGQRRGGFGGRRGWHRCHRGWGPGPSLFRSPFFAMPSVFRDVNPETVQALETLKRHLMETSNLSALMAAVPSAMPAVQAFLDGGIGQSGPVPQDAVDSLIVALTPALTPHVGSANVERVTAFVRQALTDEGVVGLLRQVSEISATYSPADSATDAAADAAGRARSTASRFDVHNGVACDGCNSSPIVGTRHWCTTRPNYDLCVACIANPNVDKTGMEFRAIEFPWLADDSGRKVPTPTLTFGSRGPQVSMLQKILTDLGYMTPDMYRFGVGMYGPNTAKAVNRFREHYGLGMQGQYGLYDDIVAASLLSVLESNVPPTAVAGSDTGASSRAATGAETDRTTAA